MKVLLEGNLDALSGYRDLLPEDVAAAVPRIPERQLRVLDDVLEH